MGRWRELIENSSSECRFAEPASTEALIEIEQALGLHVPEELHSLWRESDGVFDKFGDGVWSTGKTIRENLELRSYPEQDDLYMSFDALFCFAGAGNGDLFFFPIQADGKINRSDIFRWDHETDSRIWVALSLQDFVERWYRRAMEA